MRPKNIKSRLVDELSTAKLGTKQGSLPSSTSPPIDHILEQDIYPRTSFTSDTTPWLMSLIQRLPKPRLTDHSFLLTAYEEVRNDKTETNWLLVDYESEPPTPIPSPLATPKRSYTHLAHLDQLSINRLSTCTKPQCQAKVVDLVQHNGSTANFETAGAKAVMLPALGDTWHPAQKTYRILLFRNRFGKRLVTFISALLLPTVLSNRLLCLTGSPSVPKITPSTDAMKEFQINEPRQPRSMARTNRDSKESIGGQLNLPGTGPASWVSSTLNGSVPSIERIPPALRSRYQAERSQIAVLIVYPYV
ncbi:12982_t:CDS:2 [Acaulospora colombiana]|uniref:12982_t:CDS:1 n=1 Tax=Acaulospora colombiana TaxID=27376 RepID=A0ACA9P5V5_9GLOM|nr:12982_t:CDS:2 [Acaulospora colombiana]